MVKRISFTKGKAIYIIDLILIPIFILLIYSGLKLHVAGHDDNHEVWEYWSHYHIIVSIFSVLFGYWHVKAHWAWYKSLVKKGMGKKSRITLVVSLLFLFDLITGVVLVFFVEGGNSSIGMWHYRLGLLLVVFVLIHLITRFSAMIKGLGWKKARR
ncbi:MAG: DUF4405 domain-containing protein [Mangrovibacterium sp.]